MKRLSVPLTLVALAALLRLSAPPAYACDCDPGPAPVRVDNAHVVAIGKVVALTERDIDVDAVVLVQRYLKGSGPTEITVDDPAVGNCGFLDEASLGLTYLQFLNGDASPFQTSICDGSTHLAGQTYQQQLLEEVVAITGPGSAPSDEGENSVPWLPIALAAGGAAALLAASAWLLRRRIMGGDDTAHR